MDYIREYRRFVHSHYLSGAIRITVGIVLPAVLLGYLHNLSAGITVSLGAMCVGNTDNPGPIHHRRNGMLACILVIFGVDVLTGWAAGSPVWMGSCVLLMCFVFSFLGIYGSRASSIGINALLVMVLNLGRHRYGADNLYNGLYILAGGLWYTGLSLLLYSFRPYRLVQQALGDCIQATAGYLRIKASFYARDVDYDKSHRMLLDSQVAIQEKQDLLRELIFKSRKIVTESTLTGRILVMIFLDSIDLFERIMTAQQDYRQLHRKFDNSQFLEDCRKLILGLARELDEIGLAIMSGKPSAERNVLSARIARLRAELAANPAGSVSDLGNILDSIGDINDRLHALQRFTTYDRTLVRNYRSDLDFGPFVARQKIDRKLIVENLTLESNLFRHSLRVSIATIAGYIVSRFLPLGHGYWILLTVIVILKPVYSLTKKRNFARLTGTFGGALLGFLLIWLVPDRHVLFALMIVFMIGTYAFLRTNYLVAVTFITPYVLLLYHLLYPVAFKVIIADRVLDTLIGSAIAFAANIFIIPAWEHQRIGDTMAAALKANIAYFRDVAAAYLGRPSTEQQYKLSRKHAFVALANLSDAFGRMLTEPKRQQKRMSELHQFVVSNQMLTAYIATLAYYERPLAAKFADPGYEGVVKGVISRLEAAVGALQDGAKPAQLPPLKPAVTAAETGPALVQPVRDQFGFIGKVAADIYKLSLSLHDGATPAPPPAATG